MGLSFEQISSSEWAEFHNQSPQRSVFSSVEFMEALGNEISYFLIRKGSEKIAGFPALHSNSSIEVPPFSVDAGIHYGALNDLKEHSKSEIRHEVNEIFAQELFARFDTIAFNNHLSVVDLRAFDWFNYSSKAHEGGYEVKVRYTSHLHLVDGSEHFGYSQLRRRDLKNSLAEGALVEPSLSVEELDRLHNLTFRRQGIIRSEKEIKTLIGITSKMLVNGSGKLYLCRIGGQVVSATFWLVGNDMAHYLFGANDPEFRKTGSGTFCMDSAIKEIFKNYGIRTFDFVGINSPNRGSFKLSFGGVVLPYFFVLKIPSAK
jgi:hypothetical protein